MGDTGTANDGQRTIQAATRKGRQSELEEENSTSPILRAFYRYIGDVKQMVDDQGSTAVNIEDILKIFRDTYNGR